MHGKSHGKSKSKKPVVEMGSAPSGAGVSKSEIENLVEKYARQGMSPARIGEVLKREHSVPYIRQYTGKSLQEILREKKLAGTIPADLMDLMKKAVGMHKHLEKNKQDKYNGLRLRRVESKIWRLTKYYVREGVLPEGWKYDPKQAELLIKGGA
jgi:small subunit ribosomal protein S15